MADRPGDHRAKTSLFAQIALRLALLTAIFAVLDAAIVLITYANDDQALAEDFIEQQADRIRATPPSRHDRPPVVALRSPDGVSAFGALVTDLKGPSRFVGGVAPPPASLAWPTAATLDWTRRDAVAGGVLISGVRRVETPGGPYWILLSARTSGRDLFWPVMGQELLAHVVIPLVPLMILLLLFNVEVVRRMLAPLSRAASEVDALSAARMDLRLTEPASPREVAVLVTAVNRALDRLQRAIGQLRDFTANAAHELRTPLSVLRLRIDALPSGAARTALREDVQGMTRLVNQLLDMTQADALEMDGAVEIDLRDLAEEVIAAIAPHAFASGVDLRLVDRGCTPVRGQRDALGRALRNLIENAIRHAGGGGPVEVAVGPKARFSVRDHGEGLRPGEAEAMFDRFWRRRPADGGAGLGLGIVRSIVETHGGRVTARNASDGGALFTCVFPDEIVAPRPGVDSAATDLEGPP